MEEENFDQMSQMMKVMQMMKMLNESSELEKQEEYQEAEKNNSEQIKIQNFFDDKIETTEIKMLKSAIPFLQYEHQRNFAIFVKLMEMRKIIEYYNGQEISASSFDSESDWRRGMLLAMRPHLTEEKKSSLDMILKFMEMKQIMNIFKEE